MGRFSEQRFFAYLDGKSYKDIGEDEGVGAEAVYQSIKPFVARVRKLWPGAPRRVAYWHLHAAEIRRVLETGAASDLVAKSDRNPEFVILTAEDAWACYRWWTTNLDRTENFHGSDAIDEKVHLQLVTWRHGGRETLELQQLVWKYLDDVQYKKLHQCIRKKRQRMKFGG